MSDVCEHGVLVGDCCSEEQVEIQSLRQQLHVTQIELERERMRLAACGAVAMANTKQSAVVAREMHKDYTSASLDDVIRAVDSEMELRQQLEAKEQEIEALSTPMPDVVRVLDEIQESFLGAAHRQYLLERDSIRMESDDSREFKASGDAWANAAKFVIDKQAEIEQALQSQPKMKEAWCVVDGKGVPQTKPSSKETAQQQLDWLDMDHDRFPNFPDKGLYKAVRVWIEQ